MTEVEKLREEVRQMREKLDASLLIQDAMLRLLWEMRGQAKAQYGRIEKELEPAFKAYLERNKNGQS